MDTTFDEAVYMEAAKAQICELQRLYAVATDLIGEDTPRSIAEGRAIYRRIFTPDAEIKAAGVEPQIGPDAWVDLVSGALDEFNATQHFVGTQLAEVRHLPSPSHSTGAGRLTSHLQAWHAKPDGDMWHFIGTYNSEVVYTADTGWQISQMELVQVSEDYRRLTPRP